MTAAPWIELDRAAFGWRGQPVLQGLTGRFEPGTMTAVVGPNGAGKSTLLKGLAGMLRPLAGAVRVQDGRAGALAWLPQAAEVDRTFPITLLDMVAMGAWRRVGPWRRYGPADMARVHAVLEQVGLAALAGRSLAALSGGQMQRALFARLLLQDAPVLLLDEPFAAVDDVTVQALMRFLHALHAEGRTVIAVLHDLDLVRSHFGRTLLLSGRVVAWDETAAALAPANLAAARRWHGQEAA